MEKILSHGERLRPEWPVSGTTGYDFLNRVEALFIGPAGAQELERNYRRIIRQPLEFAAIARLAKRRALESGLSAGARRLAERLLKLGGPELGYRRLKTQDLYRAIVETIASLEVYRTYVDPGSPVPSNVDRGLLEAALADARSRGRAAPSSQILSGMPDHTD